MSEQVEIARRDRLWKVTLALVVVAFGGVVLWKQALMKRPQGDFGVFARAGWAVRQGHATLYRIQDDNGWHYNYPPLFALLMPPVADPPRRDVALTAATAIGQAGTSPLLATTSFAACPNPLLADEGRYLPYWASCLLFYLVNVALLFAAVRLLAGAIEPLLPPARNAAEADRRWWWWRVGPVLACVPAVGLNLMRGQVQILLLLLVCGMLAGLLRGQRFRAGLYLAGAICLKIFPAYLLLVPLVRRDRRCVAGCGLGLVLGLVLVPVTVLGPEQTRLLYLDFGKVMLGPALGLGVDAGRADELLNATATQSQSFQVVLHKTMYLGSESIPPEPDRWVKVVHLLIGGLMTLAILRRSRLRQSEGLELAGGVGMLTTLMILVCPICHLHYFTLLVPLVMAMMTQREIERPAGPNRDLWGMSMLLIGALALPMVPGFGILRNVGTPMYAALVWWFVGLSMRWHTPAVAEPTRLARAA